MPRKAAIVPNRGLNTTLPADLRGRLDLFLFSEVEGRVPMGAYQRFFTARTLEFFNDKSLDLAPFLGTMPGEFVVRGPISAIEALLNHLRQEAKV